MDQSKATVLVVDDSETNIAILQNMLRDYRVVEATDGPGALGCLEREPPDIILLDIMMPGMDGYQVCRTIKADPRWCDIPILFITARTDEASIVQGFDVGGSDYVTKPFRPRELLARVRIQLQYRHAMQQLRHVAVTDELTGIPNRRAFFERATALFATARERGEVLAAMMLDLDSFKAINDTHGHAVGDIALRGFADRVRSVLGPSDLFGRLGGEEFAILPPGRSPRQALDLAEGVREAVGDMRIATRLGDLTMTVSIGLAVTEPDTESLDALLYAADSELYQAKTQHKNCIRFRIPGILERCPGEHLRGRRR